MKKLILSALILYKFKCIMLEGRKRFVKERRNYLDPKPLKENRRVHKNWAVCSKRIQIMKNVSV